MSKKYRYYKASRNNAEIIDFDLQEDGCYSTTCVVNVRLLLCGIKTHPCGNGDDYMLNDQETLAILKVLKVERDAVQHSGTPKTLDGWRNSGLNLDEYLAVGDEVSEDLVYEQMNCVPPRVRKPGYLQVGEPYTDAWDESDGSGQYRPTYATFHMKSNRGRQYWIYAGYCFLDQDVNQVPNKDAVGKMIQAILAGGDLNK